MASGENIGIMRTGGGLPVPYRRRLPAPMPQRALAPRLITHVTAVLDRAPLAAALGAYAEGERRDSLRIPAGFFRSRTV